MNKKKKVAILGCGWLGFALAENLVQDGYCVKGSTTSPEKFEDFKNADIEPVQIQLTESGIKGDFEGFLEETNVLIIDIPPGLRKNPESDFVGKIKHLLQLIENAALEKVILVSSTSVFEDVEDFLEYSETNAPNGTSNAAKQLQRVEQLILSLKSAKGSVVRFGGLIGGDRHPAKYLAGRKNASNGKAPINLIHRKDCIALLKQAIELKNLPKFMHGVFPKHPTKEEYYTQKAKELGMEPPEFSKQKTQKGKRISSEATRKKLDLEFCKELYGI